MRQTCMSGSISSAPLLRHPPQRGPLLSAPCQQRASLNRRGLTTVAGFGERLLDYIEGAALLLSVHAGPTNRRQSVLPPVSCQTSTC